MFRIYNYQFPSATIPITSWWDGVFTVIVMITLTLFVIALEFLVRFFKFHNFCGQLHVGIIMLMWRILTAWIALVAFPCEGLFGVPSFSYLRHSMKLWVLCVPPCCLNRMQCFAFMRRVFWIWLLKATIFFLEEPPFCALVWVPSHSLSVRKTFLMCSRSSRNLQTLWGTVAPMSLYWSCQYLVTVLRMWLAKFTSSNSFMTLFSLVERAE